MRTCPGLFAHIGLFSLLALFAGGCGGCGSGGTKLDGGDDGGLNCTLDSDCDDQNPCTADTCDQTACDHAPQEGACDDGLACTENDRCVDGACTGDLPVECDDENPCTDDGCDESGCTHAPNQAACDDGLFCTSDDACDGQGACTGTPVDCSQADGVCVLGTCDEDSQACVGLPAEDGAACDDADACSSQDTCLAGACQAGPTDLDADSDGYLDAACPGGDDCADHDPAINLGAAEGPQGDPSCSDQIDNNCDGLIDLAGGNCGDCIADDQCDDSNPCTANSCQQGACVFTPNAAACDDGDACTFGDLCADGACAGTQYSCDDANPCTDDACTGDGTCDHVDNSLACDDGIACTTGDVCANGTCAGAPYTCDDGNPCTDDACTGDGGCATVNNTRPCDDADACTSGDRCAGGACAGAPYTCDDGNPCTDDSCNGDGTCASVDNTAACDDGNACTHSDTCAGGACDGTPYSCDDANPCTTDTCQGDGSCDHADNNLACDDGDACTHTDRCAAGACGGTAYSCDDSNPCTNDSCLGDGNCTHADNAAPCDDADPCSSQDTCSGGACQAGPTDLDADGDNYFDAACPNGTDCDDAAPGVNPGVFEGPEGDPTCSDGIDNDCDGRVDLQEASCGQCNADADCDDADVCNGSERCVANACQPGVALNCADGDPCTDDACDPAAGCQHTFNTSPCDDADACTFGDRCASGSCSGTPYSCDDSNPCTNDACNGDGTCANAPNNDPCSDGDPCTSGDTCSAGACTGTPYSCDDANPCTTDSCDGGGCGHADNNLPCDDANPCTSGDRCGGGACAGTPYSCDDGNPCTDDACDGDGTCTWTDNTAACDDGNACTHTDICSGGLCDGTPYSCDDGNPCTTDACNGDGSCDHQNNSVACDDSNACTHTDRCGGGTCAGTSYTCDDGNGCTTDTCNGDGSCSFTANTAPCDDGDPCSSLDACSGGACQAGPTDLDVDGDTFFDQACPGGNDCDDSDPDRNPGVFEGPAGSPACSDGIDNDCDALVDLQEASCGDCNSDADCDDHDACNGVEHCVANACQAGTPPNCNDSDVCTDDSCVPATGCQHVSNTAACNDGNACTHTDTCSAGTCAGTAYSCDDSNPCTNDSCTGDGNCNHANNTNPCNDGDACTHTDRCSGGTCSGTAYSCADGDVCTDDACDGDGTCTWTYNTAPCDDANPCTQADTCAGGTCAGSAYSCDDSNPCTTDACTGDGNCGHANNTNPCNDGDACTHTDRCSGGACAGTAYVCNDGDVCTDDSCDGDGTCTWTDNTAPCDDSNPCTWTDQCSGGTCAGISYACDDGNGCTTDTCNGDGSCSFAANTALCDDGDPCSSLDACAGGSCQAGPTSLDADGDTYFDAACPGGSDCDDSDPNRNPGVFEGPAGSPACADGIDNDCDALVDLQEASCGDCNGDADCDDHDACNGVEHCVANACQAGTPPNCDDSEVCTDDACVPATGCQHVNNTTACNDGDACTHTDTCSAGTCAGTAYSCDDSNPCTNDVCLGNGNCSHPFNTSPCDDANPCTQADHCAGGACAGTAYSCNDGDVCTDDACDGDGTCTWTYNTAPCNDADPCTQADTCSGGTCAGTAYSCNDANPCTNDTCLGDGNCNHSFNTSPCNDGDACTHTDRCSAGTCAGTGYDCGDGNACTDDACDGDGTCTWTDNSDPCDDANPCTHTDHCSTGACSGTLYSCNDSNVCTADACAGDGTCIRTPQPGGCNDSDACTVNDHCQDGACVGDIRDQDGDTYADKTCGADDCDDLDPDVNPGTPEACGDSVDNDCDELTDEGCASCAAVDPAAELRIDNDVGYSGYGLLQGDRVLNAFVADPGPYNLLEVQATFHDFTEGTTGSAQGDFSVHVYEDSDGLPGAELGSSGVETVTEADDVPHVFSLAAPVPLTQGQLFWVAVQFEQDQDTNLFLPYMDADVLGPYHGGLIYVLADDEHYLSWGNWLIRAEGCAEGPWLSLTAHSSAPAIVPAGATATVSTTLSNTGFADTADVIGILSTSEAGLTVTQPFGDFGVIGQGGSTGNTPAYQVAADPSAFGIFPMTLLSSDGLDTWTDGFGIYVQGSGCAVDNRTIQVHTDPYYYLPPAAGDELGNYFVVDSTAFTLTSVEADYYRNSGPTSRRFRVKVYTYRAGYPDQLLWTSGWQFVNGTGVITRTFDLATPLTFHQGNVFWVTTESQTDLTGTEFGVLADSGDIGAGSWANGVIRQASDGSWSALNLAVLVRPHGCEATELRYDSHVAVPASPGPGDTVDLTVTIANDGAVDATNVSAVLSSADPDVSVLLGSSNYGTVPAAGTAVSQSAYRVQIAPGADAYQYLLDLQITDGINTWDDQLPLRLAGGVVDLAFSEFSTTLVGNDIHYHFVVVNQGNVDCVTPFRVDLYVDEETPPGPQQDGDWNDAPAGLALGDALTYDLALSDVSAGTYDAYVQADTLEAVAESNEANNLQGPDTQTVGTTDVFELLPNPAKWFPVDMPVPYRFVTGNSQPGLTQTEARDAVRAGFQHWQDVPTASITFAEEAATALGGFRNDGHSTMTFNDPDGDLSTGTLAATLPIYTMSQTMVTNSVTFYRMTDADIVFNDGVAFGTNAEAASPACVDQTDIEGVATHEQGHLLGLDHPDVYDATMYYAIGPCDPSKVTLELSDINGVTFIYP